jgi:hypothetical protein
MHVNSQIGIFSLVAVFGCATWLSIGTAPAQEPLAPAAILQADTAVIVDAQPNYVMEQPSHPHSIPFRPTISRSAYDAAKARAANSYVPGAVKPFPDAFSTLGSPIIKGTNFEGTSSTDNLRPPDTNGAVGQTHFIEVTNSHIEMWKRQSPTPVLVKNVTLASFFSYTAQTIFDPRVVYDSTWNRWVVTADAFPESSTVQRLFIGVSTSADPTLAFFIYKVDVDFFNNNDFYDFPQLGLDQDAVLFTANIFPVGGGSSADFFAVAKASLYNGLGFSVPVFTGLVGTLAPPRVLDQNASTFLVAAPPSGTTFFKYTATNTSHPASTSLAGSTITVPSYTVPPSAHQSGTTDLLDTLDARFVNASTQNGNDLWQTHTIGIGGFPTPVFYRLNTLTNSVTQSGSYFASGSSDDFNASITANTAGDCFVTYTSTDATVGTNAQVRLSGKLNADSAIAAGPLGFTSPTFYNASSDTTERWGDYSAVTVDPTNKSIAWLVNEKVNSGGLLWGSRIINCGF